MKMDNPNLTSVGGIITNYTDENMNFQEVIDMQGSWQPGAEPTQTIGKNGGQGAFLAANGSGPTAATIIYKLDSGAAVTMYFCVGPCPTMPVYKISCTYTAPEIIAQCYGSCDTCDNGQPRYLLAVTPKP
jgi:hypothetical protein